MGSAQRKFFQRAHRYVLRPSDNGYMRFAHKDDTQCTFSTRLHNLSTTGMAFVTHKDAVPSIGDMIKVEIPTLDGKTIAWWAQIARIEEYNPKSWWLRKSDFAVSDEVMVGVRFHEMPMDHMREIRDSIQNNMDKLRQDSLKSSFKRMAMYSAENFWRILLFLICFLASAWILYSLAQPTSTYSTEKGSPWGQRYKIKDLFN